MSSDPDPQPLPVRRRSGRKKRIQWTAAFLLVAAAGGTWLGIGYYRTGRINPYRPGESDAEITSALAQPYERRDSHKSADRQPADVPRGADDGLRAIQQSIPAGAPAPRFVDVSGRAGLSSFRTFARERTSQLPEDMGSGAAWGDFDNDGFEDLFLVSAGGAMDTPSTGVAPSMLFRNMGDGTFQRVEDFPELRIHGMAAAWGDYNNDGWLDLIVTGYNTLMLFRNDHGSAGPRQAFPGVEGLLDRRVMGRL